MGKKHKKPSSDDVKDEKKQKTSHASSSSKSLEDGKSMLLEPCSPSQANLKIHKEKSEKRDEDEQIVSRSEFEEMNKSSNPTNVETTGASSSKSLKEGKSTTLKPCSKSQSNLKIHKEKSEKRDEDEQIVSRSEFEEMKKSIIELSRSMINLQETLTKVELLENSLKEKETPKRKEEAKFTCCFDFNGFDVVGNSNTTIFVKGFENLRPREEIRKDLSNLFGSCGKVTRVFVPIECKSRLPLGFAFIDLKNGEGNDKALELSGSYMGGKELEVTMATKDGEYSAYSNFEGCERCLGSAFMRCHFYDTVETDKPYSVYV